MAHEKFKKTLKKMSIDELNAEVQKRKLLLIEWNNPREKMRELLAADPHTKTIRTKCRHPYDKIRKQIAILYTEINRRQNRRLRYGTGRLAILLLAMILIWGCKTAEVKTASCLELKAEKLCTDDNALFDSISNSQKEFKCLSENRQILTEYKFTAKEIKGCI